VHSITPAAPSSCTRDCVGILTLVWPGNYKRWSRGTERNGLIPAFGAIVASYALEEQIFSFQLSFGEGSELQEWIVHEPVERFDRKWGGDRTFIGVSSPHGIVPLFRASVNTGYRSLTGLEYPPLPRESEYITTDDNLDLPIGYFFSFHNLKAVRMSSSWLGMRSSTQSSPEAPLFHTLKVLVVRTSRLSPLASQTFHKLERYQEDHGLGTGEPRQDRLTEIPVCTRLVTSLSKLATLKLPQVCELEVRFGYMEKHDLWEKHVAVNARLSGLKLLNLSIVDNRALPFIDITKILEPLLALETLVLHNRKPYGIHLEAFIRIPEVLCPRLESLQIEGIRPTDQPGMMPILKSIVTLRAIIGSPLKSFTYGHWNQYPCSFQKWELVGRDGSFMMEEVVPAQRFKLDI